MALLAVSLHRQRGEACCAEAQLLHAYEMGMVTLDGRSGWTTADAHHGSARPQPCVPLRPNPQLVCVVLARVAIATRSTRCSCIECPSNGRRARLLETGCPQACCRVCGHCRCYYRCRSRCRRFSHSLSHLLADVPTHSQSGVAPVGDGVSYAITPGTHSCVWTSAACSTLRGFCLDCLGMCPSHGNLRRRHCTRWYSAVLRGHASSLVDRRASGQPPCCHQRARDGCHAA